MLRWDEFLRVGDKERFSAKPSDKWLDGEEVINGTMTVEDSSVATVSSIIVHDNVISGLFTGVANGYTEVTVKCYTETRERTVKVILAVRSCH